MNYYQLPTQFAIYCTDTSSEILYGYSNSYMNGQVLAALPTGTFTPSWPGSTSTSDVPVTIVRSGSIFMTYNGSDSTMKTSTAQSSSVGTNNTIGVGANSTGLEFNTSGIVGIAVGSLLALVAVVAFIVFLARSYRKHKAANAIQESQTQQLPRGTLGGAVLPGTWLDKNGEDDRATDRLLTNPTQNQGPLISEQKPTAGVGLELADTMVPDYSRELASPQMSMSSSATGLGSASGIGFRPYSSPYSPMDILRPAVPYSNTQASRSEPMVTAYNHSRPSSETFGRVDGQSWVQHGHAYDHQQNRVSAPLPMSIDSQSIRPVTASLSIHSSDQLLLQNHVGSLISPMSNSLPNTTPSSPQHEATSSARDSPHVGPNQSLSNTPSTNNIFIPSILLPGIPATPTTSTTANSSGLAPERASYLSTRQHDSATEGGISAHGDWRGWVSPESALSQLSCRTTPSSVR